MGEAPCDRFPDDPHGKDSDPLLSDSDLKEADADALVDPSKATTSSPLLVQRSHELGVHDRPPEVAHVASVVHHSNATSVIHSPPSAPKPKLWSLAEIATSSDRCRGGRGGGGGGGGDAGGTAQNALPAVSAASPSRTSTQCALPSGAVLSRPLYYTSPFYAGYTNYGSFGHLHGSHGSVTSSAATHFNGISPSVLNRAEALARESKARSQAQVDLCKDSPYELKKGMSNI